MNNIEEILKQALIIEGAARILRERDDADAEKLLTDAVSELNGLFGEPSQEAPLIEKDIEDDVEVAEPVVDETKEAKIPPCIDENEEEVVEEQPVSIEEEPVESEEPKQQSEMRVDEMLTRRGAKDIRKAFTLNDKFRFRRELFCNNDPLFIHTLDQLQDMATLEDALAYLSTEMGWDLEDEDVADFVAIITNHYL